MLVQLVSTQKQMIEPAAANKSFDAADQISEHIAAALSYFTVFSCFRKRSSSCHCCCRSVILDCYRWDRKVVEEILRRRKTEC